MLQLINKLTDKVREKVAALSEKGQGMVEYAMIIAAVALIAVAVLWTNDNSLSESVSNAFGTAATNVDKAASQDGAGSDNTDG